MTPALFMEWKRKKIAERDAGLAASQAERAKNDRMRLKSTISSFLLPSQCDSLLS